MGDIGVSGIQNNTRLDLHQKRDIGEAELCDGFGSHSSEQVMSNWSDEATIFNHGPHQLHASSSWEHDASLRHEVANDFNSFVNVLNDFHLGLGRRGLRIADASKHLAALTKASLSFTTTDESNTVHRGGLDEVGLRGG
jgi:hypothetical protein